MFSFYSSFNVSIFTFIALCLICYHSYYQWFLENRHISWWAKVSWSDTFITKHWSLLFRISKMFEKMIYHQIIIYIEPFWFQILTGFCKNHNSTSAIFMNPSKAFDTQNHDLLIAQLEAYGFFAKSLSYIHCYPNKRLQKTNVNCDCS